MIERREFPRRPLSEDVHCYIDGVRFDARTLDLSAGGTFVRTSRWRSVSMGALVGMVFPRNRLSPHTTFLFGRVARIQEGVVEGLALAWEKAVTVAPPEDLARFLAVTFGIQDSPIQREAPGPRGESRNVFFFASLAGSGLRNLPGDEVAEAAPSRPAAVAPGGSSVPGNGNGKPVHDPFDAAALGLEGLQVSAEDLDGLDLQVIALDRDGMRLRDGAAASPTPPAATRDGPREAPRPEAGSAGEEPPDLPFLGSPPPAAPRRGQISAMVARDALLPVALSAVLQSGRDHLPLEVVRLGLAGAFARSAFAPIDGATDLVLRFEIPARRGPVSVACQCLAVDVAAGPDGNGTGLRLRFASIHESDSPGVLERYLKYLQFQDLARS